MALTLGTTGMDSATQTEVRAAFQKANAQIGGKWTLVADDNADYVLIDMDSIYGPMSWMRLHASGRKVIGLTSIDKDQTDYRLMRPLSASDLAVLLSEIQVDSPSSESAVVPVASTPAPTPVDHLPDAHAMPDDDVEASPSEAPVMAPIPAAIAPPAEREPAPIPVIEAAPDRPLAHWLIGNALERRVRLKRGDGQALLIDPRTKVYHGPATLKPLTAFFEGTLRIEDFETPGAAAWETEAGALGSAQPFARLQWLAGLLAGNGNLLPGNDPDGQYRLTKWPQTEREYPKHFRIATAMMKGPSTLDEIAAASGVDRADIADFVNANLATGYAELVLPTPPEPEAPAKASGGLFGRMRGR